MKAIASGRGQPTMAPMCDPRNSDLACVHQALAHRPHRHALVGQELGEAELAARIDQRMLAHQVLDLGLGPGVECVVGGAHVGELGVRASLGHDSTAQDRILGRHGAERGVRVPQPIAERGHASLVVARQLAAIPVQIGDVGKGRGESQLRIPDRRIGAFLQLTEVAREGELLLVGDILIGQDQHRVPVHGGIDRPDLVRRQQTAHIDARQARADAGGEGFDLDRHGPIIFLVCSAPVEESGVSAFPKFRQAPSRTACTGESRFSDYRIFGEVRDARSAVQRACPAAEGRIFALSHFRQTYAQEARPREFATLPLPRAERVELPHYRISAFPLFRQSRAGGHGRTRRREPIFGLSDIRALRSARGWAKRVLESAWQGVAG
jgi:hypothetical protein